MFWKRKRKMPLSALLALVLVLCSSFSSLAHGPGDALYPSGYFPWSKFASGKQGQDPGYLNRYSDLSADNPAIAWQNDGDTSNDRCVLLHEGEFYYNPAVFAVRERIVTGVEEVVNGYEFRDQSGGILNSPAPARLPIV